MKWMPMGREYAQEEVRVAYKQARPFDHIRVGATMLFARRFLTVYYIPYEEIEKIHLYAGGSGGQRLLHLAIGCTCHWWAGKTFWRRNGRPCHGTAERIKTGVPRFTPGQIRTP